jgi:hypothetical protein
MKRATKASALGDRTMADFGKNLESACKAYAYRAEQQRQVQKDREYMERMEAAWEAHLDERGHVHAETPRE